MSCFCWVEHLFEIPYLATRCGWFAVPPSFGTSIPFETGQRQCLTRRCAGNDWPLLPVHQRARGAQLFCWLCLTHVDAYPAEKPNLNGFCASLLEIRLSECDIHRISSVPPVILQSREQVAILLDSINSRLGMDASACHRFRDMVSSPGPHGKSSRDQDKRKLYR